MKWLSWWWQRMDFKLTIYHHGNSFIFQGASEPADLWPRLDAWLALQAKNSPKS